MNVGIRGQRLYRRHRERRRHRGRQARVTAALLAVLLAGLAQLTLAAAASPAAAATALTRAQLAAQLNHYLLGRSDVGEVTVFDRRSGLVVYSAPRGAPKIKSMSTIKLAILATLLRQAARAHRTFTATELAQSRAMIELSDNDAADDLYAEIGGLPAVMRLLHDLGCTPLAPPIASHWGEIALTSAELNRVTASIAYGHPALAGADLAYERYLMAHVVASQRWGVSYGPASVAGVTIQLKNGWATGGYRVHSTGHIVGAGRDYVVSVMTYRNTSMSYGVTTTQGVSSIVWRVLAVPLRR